jgi:hypothetical protein
MPPTPRTTTPVSNTRVQLIQDDGTGLFYDASLRGETTHPKADHIVTFITKDTPPDNPLVRITFPTAPNGSTGVTLTLGTLLRLLETLKAAYPPKS